MKTPRKRAATIRNPTLEAIRHGLFRFDEEWQAVKRLEVLKSHFIVAKEQEENVWPPSLTLWIRDYGVSEEEAKEGYRGHFARIVCQKMEDGKFTLTMEKQDVPLSRHPQKKRPPRSHPDWGHPILRRLHKEEVFATLEEARALLMQLHEQYPKTSIPGQNHLYIMIYRREKEPGKLPVQKWKLVIETIPESGGYRIAVRDNEKRVTGTPETSPDGFFAARVKLSQRRKK